MSQTLEEFQETLRISLDNLKNAVEQVPNVTLEVSAELLKNYTTLQLMISDYIRLRADEVNRTTGITEQPVTVPETEKSPKKLPGQQGDKKDEDK